MCTGAGVAVAIWAAELPQAHVGFWPRAGEVAGLALIALGILLAVAMVRGWWLPGGFRDGLSDPDQEANTVAPPAVPEASQPPAQRASQGTDVPEDTAEILTATAEPRVMCPLSPMELTRLFSRGETQLQGESLVAQYKDQWRQVSATVEQVTRHNDYVVSVSGKDSDQVTVTFFFKPDQWAARLQGLMRGDPVSAIGQVDLVDQSHVIFNHCELV
jgi:hypothetical protein